MKLDAFDLVRLDLPLRQPFRTVDGETATRPVILVRAAIGDRVGWGEAAPYPGHTSDSIDEAWHILVATAERSTNGYVDIDPIADGSSSRAALDGALVTLRSAVEGKPLGHTLGATSLSVRASASIGLQPDAPSLLSSVGLAVDAGYRCLKVKVAHQPSAVASVIRKHFPDIAIGLDANGAFTPDDMSELRALDVSSIAFVEQPYPVGMERETAELAAVLQTPVALDESIRSLTDVTKVLSGPPVDVLTVKPARLGVTDCLRARDLAVADGVSLRVGGMLETGVGRAIGAALAACEGFTVFGDLSASGWHFPTELTRLEQQSGLIEVPTGEGLGLDVTIDESRVVDRASYTWPQQ
ncbi:MAG: hypothetical protein HKN07_00940 [Acidimicrobiia bacterium]|nr:hypothetical protein [Acidimicrobiia bacterium]